MSTEVILAIIAAVTVVLVVILWQGMSVAKTQMITDQLYQYRKLAEQVAESEQKSVEAQQKTAEALVDMQVRLAAIEKLLKEVQ